MNLDILPDHIQKFVKGKVGEYVRNGVTDYPQANGEKLRIYVDDEQRVIIEWYRTNGSRISSETFVNKQLHGRYTEVYENGVVASFKFYNCGSLDLAYHVYYPTGQLAIEGQYKKGKMIGTWRRYRKDGTCLMHSVFDYGGKVLLSGPGYGMKMDECQSRSVL